HLLDTLLRPPEQARVLRSHEKMLEGVQAGAEEVDVARVHLGDGLAPDDVKAVDALKGDGRDHAAEAHRDAGRVKEILVRVLGELVDSALSIDDPQAHKMGVERKTERSPRGSGAEKAAHGLVGDPSQVRDREARLIKLVQEAVFDVGGAGGVKRV